MEGRFTSKVRTFRPTTVRAARIRANGFARRISTSFTAGRTPRSGHVRLVTLSPEWPEALRYIEQVVPRRRGGQHRPHPRDAAADSRRGERRRDAFDAPGQRRASRRCRRPRITSGSSSPKIAWRRASSSTGIHLPDAFLRAALRAKGIERSILITDAVMPAMCAPGSV